MALQLASNIVPSSGGTFYLLEDLYLKGGFQVRDTVAARDTIALSNLKIGQLVLTVADSKIWKVKELVLQTRDNPDVEEKVTWEEFLTGEAAAGGLSDAPRDGKVYGRKDGAWVKVTASVSGEDGEPITPKSRTVAIATVPALLAGATQDIELDLAVSCIMLKLSLSRPARLTIYGTPGKDEPNPYTFQATEDHLTDDGSMLLADGSVFRTRNFSILANMENTPSEKFYATVESVDDAEDAVVITMTYLPLEVVDPTAEQPDV